MREREERRIWPVTEVRAERGEGDDLVYLEGYAAVFGSWSQDLGGFRERIAPGFFEPALDRSDVRFLVNHDGLPLARYRKGEKDTLALEERELGLWFRTGLAASDPDVQRLIPKIERGDLDQMSFAFRLPIKGGDEWEEDGEHLPSRTLTLCDELFDVSPVTYPAYTDTTVAKRSLPHKRLVVDPRTRHRQMLAAATEARLRERMRAG